MIEGERIDAAAYRRTKHHPMHSPPHFGTNSEAKFLITAACYEHAHIIAKDAKRMTDFESDLLAVCQNYSIDLFAWCILPNHYHVLLKTGGVKRLIKKIGVLHVRTSYYWNGEEDKRGRHVLHNCFERKISSAGHFFASLNYVLNNAVHHGYVDKWTDWEWSNAREYLEQIGPEKEKEIWLRYPVKDYGKKWDVF